MKYIIVILFSLSIIACSEESIDYEGMETVIIPDPNFERALIEEGIDTKGVVDGRILVVDAESTVSLDLSYKSINNLTGLTAFINLEVFIAFNNELEEVNVSGNPLLTHLFLGNNNLKKLDLTKNTLLEDVRIANNQLVSLNLSKNTVLSQIECHNNLLENIDLANNPELSFFQPFHNKIKTINLSSCVKLKDMDIRNNELVALDVSDNLELSSLTIENNSKLGCLKIGDNQVINYIYKDSHTEVSTTCN